MSLNEKIEQLQFAIDVHRSSAKQLEEQLINAKKLVDIAQNDLEKYLSSEEYLDRKKRILHKFAKKLDREYLDKNGILCVSYNAIGMIWSEATLVDFEKRVINDKDQILISYYIDSDEKKTVISSNHVANYDCLLNGSSSGISFFPNHIEIKEEIRFLFPKMLHNFVKKSSIKK